MLVNEPMSPVIWILGALLEGIPVELRGAKCRLLPPGEFAVDDQICRSDSTSLWECLNGTWCRSDMGLGTFVELALEEGLTVDSLPAARVAAAEVRARLS